MGDCMNCFKKLNCFKKRGQQTPVSGDSEPGQTSSEPKVEEVINDLQAVLDTADLKEFVRIIKQQLEEKKSDKGSTIKSAEEEKGRTSESAEENKGMWTSFVTSGAKFLEFVNGHTAKLEIQADIFNPGNSRIVADILRGIGQLHWIVAGLAITSYLIEKINQISANKAEALQLLSNMVDLGTTIITLRDVIPEEEEKLKNAIVLVVQGSIMCISQIHSQKIIRFLKTSVNSEMLTEMSNRLNHLYRDLTLTITTAIAKRQSALLPVPKPFYPKDAVGIEDAQQKVINLLNMTNENDSTVVVVIYGFGGIGKTTLAKAVLAMLNLDGYNYTRVLLDEEQSKNNLKEMQELILKDAFPRFHSGASIKLRDCQEGKDRLKEAFLCTENNPIFLFIDNVLRSDELKQLLPEDLSDLPKGSRIFLTTRMLDQTDIFLSLKRRSFAMKVLKTEDAEKILCKDPHSRELIKHDMERIMRICGGIPLALRIVRGHLDKMGYNAGKCSRILDALEKGSDVREDSLSRRLIEFVYNELDDSTKDAFLDICWFFSGRERRHIEFVVGAQEVKSLEEAALLTTFVEVPRVPDLAFACEELLLVHDIVRAKGRAMSASTRIMDVASFREAAEDETKLKAIKGLQLGEGEEYVLGVNHLNSMRHSLRYLSLGSKSRTSAQSPMKFKELRFLLVPRDSGDLPMKVEELPMLRRMCSPTKGISVKQLPNSLSYLLTDDLSSTQGIQNHSLEELVLAGLTIKRVPEVLHQLSSLKFLILYGFDEMEEFPDQVCKLSSLTKLKIFGWACLKRLPPSFGGLKRLTQLQIEECYELEELPSTFGELTVLNFLLLRDCGKLKQELPGGLESLKYLFVSN